MGRHTTLVSEFPPMQRRDAERRGWLPSKGEPNDPERHGVDFVFVSGDAFVDHPSFANAVIVRLLEAQGYRVAVLAQPDWRSADPFKVFGAPRIAWLVSAGNLDSMLNNYTAHKRPRSDDQYSPDAAGGKRPDYATVVYAQRCREAARDVPIIAGGVEVSMRRLAHYDYWQDKVRRSMIVDGRADLVIYGMGEKPLLEVIDQLKAGTPIDEIRNVKGTGYAVGKRGRPHFVPETLADDEAWEDHLPDGVKVLSSYEDICGTDAESKQRFAKAQHIFHKEQTPGCAPILIQKHGTQTVVINPPQQPLTSAELDAIFALPYNKIPHPDYGGARIPAYQTVRFSINVMRGCFGGCTFCAITEHQGKAIQSRSRESVMREVEDLQRVEGYTGAISDLGGPTANMYKMTCSDPEVEKVCRRPSCVHPKICKLLVTDHTPIKNLMRDVRQAAGVKKVMVASGVRMDLANLDQEYIDELAAHHVGGHLKVAPEHVDSDTLRLMKKPGIDVYVEFEERFKQASDKAKKEQYLVPYFVSSHPGCDVKSAVNLAEFLKARNLRPRQVQDFIPTPGTPATCMWWTGVEPHTMKTVWVERKMRNKRKQKALMQYWMPENSTLVREALHEADRKDLIGRKHDSLAAPANQGQDRRTRRSSRRSD
jgi:uncharacterized radical SAM protein YgiQ